MENFPSSFLDTVVSAIEERKLVPMWGQTPTVSSKDLQKALQKSFDLEEVPKVTLLTSDWIEEDHLLEGIGDNVSILTCKLSPLTPPFYLAVSLEDISQLTKALLSEEASVNFTDSTYTEGFFRFVFLKFISQVNQQKLLGDLNLKLASDEFKAELSYVSTGTVSFGNANFAFKAIFPKTFHQVVTSHFEKAPFSFDHLDTVNPTLDLSLRCGHVDLLPSELDKVEVGDFLVLDSCSFVPEKNSGSMTLCLGNTPLLITHFKQKHIKIVDYALFSEESSMDYDDTPKDDEDFDDLEFEDEEDFEDDTDLDDDTDFDDDEEDFEDDTDLDNDEEDFEDKNSQITEKLTSAQNVPLDVAVEVGRLSMPLKNLLALKPGNTLEVRSDPRAKVVLTVRGKAIASGQLVQLGETIGVKITEIS